MKRLPHLVSPYGLFFAEAVAMKWISLIIVAGIWGCGAITLPPSPPPVSASHNTVDATANTGTLRIVALDIGQGDATFVTTPSGHRFLIDGGPVGSGRRVTLPYLSDKGITQLDHLFATHYDSDHIGGLPEILAGSDGMAGTPDDVQVAGDCWDHGDSPEKHTPAFAAYVQATANCERVAIPGDRITFEDGVSIEVIAINGVSQQGPLLPLDPSDENGTSMVLRIQYGEFTYLTTGDLPGGGGNPPFDTVDLEGLLAPLIGPMDVLHLGHHGSHTSSSPKFLEILSPKAAIISVGDGNTYYHPHPSILQRLADLGIPVYQTERGHPNGTEASHIMNGNIVIETDGEGFEIKAD
jgi:competence protein ComEC